MIPVLAAILLFNVAMKGFEVAQDGAEKATQEISQGVRPPIEVGFGIGFDAQARDSYERRKKFFETHELINGQWQVKP